MLRLRRYFDFEQFNYNKIMNELFIFHCLFQQWCRENYLNFRNLTYAQSIREQLSDLCVRQKLQISSCNQNYEQVNVENPHFSEQINIFLTMTFIIQGFEVFRCWSVCEFGMGKKHPCQRRW